MTRGYFELTQTDDAGNSLGVPQQVRTKHGVVLQCPIGMSPIDIEHYCDLAYAAPGFPVDMCFWRGKEGARVLAWSARLTFIEGD